MTTKDRILDSALNLFSEKGYDGVGVDLIAENAQLKGPSIYKHFKGKEDILNVLIERVEAYYELNFGLEVNPGTIHSSIEELVDGSMKRIQFTLHDEMIKKTRKILMKEQFRNPRIAKLATKYNIDGIQGMYGIIFQKMMEAGIIRKDNPKMLAMAFVSPITLLLQMCDREPDREKEAMEVARTYLEHFAEKIAEKQNQKF